jgi:hypothetical protein
VQSNGGSCAAVIEMNGTQYMAGRQSKAVPVTDETMPAQSVKCAEAADGPETTPVVATKLQGIAVEDAVAADGYQLMLAQRLWRVAWIDLPKPLQPYVRHSRG